MTSPEAPPSRRRAYGGYALLTLAVLMWAGNSIVGRMSADEEIPPLALNFWRWTCASAFFVVLAGRATWRQRRSIAAGWRFVVPFSLLSVAGFNSVFYLALQSSTVLQVALIQSVLPVAVLLLGFAVLGEAISARQWLGVAFSVAGAALVLARGDLAVLGALELDAGDLWALLAVAMWALQAFVIRWKPRDIEIMPFMTSISLVGVAAMAPFYAWESAAGAAMPFTGTSAVFVLYIGLVASVIGTSCWNEGTWRAGGAQAGYFGNLFPVFASLLAIVALGEAPRWYHAAAAAAVVTGIWLATSHHARSLRRERNAAP